MGTGTTVYNVNTYASIFDQDTLDQLSIVDIAITFMIGIIAFLIYLIKIVQN